ncbi:MAG: 1-acyl-sn-glycerol-3-phosphate acyltransferase [Fimbriimonadaceae bacterium]|nr:1-acyl-sn-glycerol-3-phosphate acyltransferase [Alphaproteobacteria bacterium]
MRALRACLVILLLSVLVIPAIVIQTVLLLVWRKGAAHFPTYFFCMVCALVGMRVRTRGRIAENGPVLIVSNHSSWLDIPAISCCGQVSFVAKHEIASWPLFGILARLGRSIFIDRSRRHATGKVTGQLASRLADGDKIVLFAEGTSSDGNRVLPFKSAMIGAAEKAIVQSGYDDILVQPMSITYVRRRGLPISRVDRPYFAWFGDMNLLPHIWGVLMRTPIDVVINFGTPHKLTEYANRKELARQLETDVRRMVLSSILGRELREEDVVASPVRLAQKRA